MRESELGTKTIELLLSGQYKEAAHSFMITCDKLEECENVAKCTKSCLIPKLRYMSLSNEDTKIDIIIADLTDLLLIGGL